MRPPWPRDTFDDVHLDPACDLPALYREGLELFGELWGQLEMSRAALGHDALLDQLLTHLQSQLVGAALILDMKINLAEKK
jgi:hypothetical protein